MVVEEGRRLDVPEPRAQRRVDIGLGDAAKPTSCGPGHPMGLASMVESLPGTRNGCRTEYGDVRRVGKGEPLQLVIG